MAVVLVTSPTFTASINGVNDYTLPPASEGVVSRWLIELISVGGFTGSCTVKARLAGNGQTLMAIPYIGLFVNNAVGTGALGSAAITTTSLIEVDSTGQEISISCTAYTNNSLLMTARPVQG